MIDRSRYFSRLNTKPSRSDYKVIKERVITLLKTHPCGMAIDDLAHECGLTLSCFTNILLEGSLANLPIGYDRRIDNRMYWVGRR